MSEPHDINRKWWNEVTPVHVASSFYDVEGFVGGRNTLGRVEREAVGEVVGKRLLHLQCHFGMDTLSWARLGATVVGVDFSEDALRKARALSAQVGLAHLVSFHEADVTRAGKIGGGGFDVIFTSFGTIGWLESLDGWAATITANLGHDGFFYFLDSHPTCLLFDETKAKPALRYDYFPGDGPLEEPAGGRDYADPSYAIASESRQFVWALQDVFGALERQGLTVFEVREYPFGAWRQFPDMEPGEDGYWYRRDPKTSLPILLGFKARWLDKR